MSSLYYHQQAERDIMSEPTTISTSTDAVIQQQSLKNKKEDEKAKQKKKKTTKKSSTKKKSANKSTIKEVDDDNNNDFFADIPASKQKFSSSSTSKKGNTTTTSDTQSDNASPPKRTKSAKLTRTKSNKSAKTKSSPSATATATTLCDTQFDNAYPPKRTKSAKSLTKTKSNKSARSKISPSATDADADATTATATATTTATTLSNTQSDNASPPKQTKSAKSLTKTKSNKSTKSKISPFADTATATTLSDTQSNRRTKRESTSTTTTYSNGKIVEEKPPKKKRSKKNSSSSSSTPADNTTEVKQKTKKTKSKKKKSKTTTKIKQSTDAHVSIDPTDIKLCIASSKDEESRSVSVSADKATSSNEDRIASLKDEESRSVSGKQLPKQPQRFSFGSGSYNDNDNDNDNDNFYINESDDDDNDDDDNDDFFLPRYKNYNTVPSFLPNAGPTSVPSSGPSHRPSGVLSDSPPLAPSISPSTSTPTSVSPSASPSDVPTSSPSMQHNQQRRQSSGIVSFGPRIGGVVGRKRTQLMTGVVGRRLVLRRNGHSRRKGFAATKGQQQNQNFRIETNPNAMKVQRLEVHFYNHGMEIALYILFIAMQILVGCYGAYQFTPMGGFNTDNQVLKYTLPIARAGGRLVTFNCALLLITACKYLWTMTRTYIAPIIPISFPIDNIMPKYHKTVAYWIIVMGCLTHTIPQIINYSTKSIVLENSFRAWTFGKDGFATTQLLMTGTLLAIIFSTFYVTTLPFFRKTGVGFRWFWFFHMGGVATAYPLLILHGTCKGSPIFLYVQLLPLLLYIFDISMRRSKTKTTKVLEWTCHDEDNGEHITELVIECPSNFNYTPGQYAELKFSPISTTEWHPFTIASAPSDDDLDISEFNNWVQSNYIEAGTKPKKKTKKLVFYIKSTGRWTEALYNYALAFDLNKAIKETEISIRGPHGAPAMNYFEYKHIIVIGSGIGVTPLMSIWKYLIQKGTSTTLGKKSLEGSTLTGDDTSYSTYDEDNNEELNEHTLLEQEQSEQQHQQKTMLRKISIKIERVLESVTISMFLLLFFVMGETIAIVMQMFTFSNGANLFGSFMSIIALIVHGCNVIVSTIVVGPYLYIRLFKFWLEVCIIVVDSFALWISLIGYMYPNSYSKRANNTTYFYLFGVVVVLHAIRIFHIFYTTLKPPKDNNTNNNNKNNSFDNGSNQMCSIQGILINKYYSGMRFAAKSLMPPLGSKLFSMEFYGTREKPELKDVSGREEEIITDLMGKSEFVRISSFNSLTEIQNQNNNRGGSSTKQEDYLSFKCGRPDWRRIFLKAMAKAHAQTNNDKNSGSKVSRGESVGVFFCGSPAITADLQTMAKEVTAQHQFTKKHLDGKACKCKLIVHSENF